MAMQTSGAITMREIANEWGGGTDPISLSEYYGADAGIPTSGTISMSNFYGKTSYHARSYTGYYSGYVRGYYTGYYRLLRG